MSQAHDCYAPLSLRSHPRATKRIEVAAFLMPKSEVVWVSASGSVEQALERMKPNGFAAVPILDDEGCYVDTLSTSDLMWFLLGVGSAWRELARATALLTVPRRLNGLVLHVDASLSALINAAIEQSFVSVVDDRGVFIGIVRRRPVIEYCARLAELDELLAFTARSEPDWPNAWPLGLRRSSSRAEPK